MKISEIGIYPVKSLKGIPLKSAEVENRGFKFDRRWLLVDKDNSFLTQREIPDMARLETAITETEVIFLYDDKKFCVNLADEPTDSANVKIWSNKCLAKIYDENVNDWFSDVFNTDCKLAFMPDESRRKVSMFYALSKNDIVSFADAYPYLLIGEDSLNDLNSKLEKQIPMNRFRPNIVVAGAEPFAEDKWKKIRAGNTIFHLVKSCARCVMTTIDQATGISDGVEPLRTLARYRIPKRSVKKKILFGQYLIAENPGEILRVGDAVEILEYK